MTCSLSEELADSSQDWTIFSSLVERIWPKRYISMSSVNSSFPRDLVMRVGRKGEFSGK